MNLTHVQETKQSKACKMRLPAKLQSKVWAQFTSPLAKFGPPAKLAWSIFSWNQIVLIKLNQWWHKSTCQDDNGLVCSATTNVYLVFSQTFSKDNFCDVCVLRIKPRLTPIPFMTPLVMLKRVIQVLGWEQLLKVTASNLQVEYDWDRFCASEATGDNRLKSKELWFVQQRMSLISRWDWNIAAVGGLSCQW